MVVYSNTEYPARAYTMTNASFEEIPADIASQAGHLLPAPMISVGSLSWEAFEKACRDGSFGDSDTVGGVDALYCYVVMVVNDSVYVMFVHRHPGLMVLDPELALPKVRAWLDDEESGALLMRYGSTREENRVYQHPIELLIVTGVVQQYFREGVGAVENLAFRRLMVTTEKTVIRPKDSLWGEDFKQCPVLSRTKKGDRLHPTGPVMGGAFPRSNEKWTAEDIPEPPESDKSGDDGASDNDHEEVEDKNKEKDLTTSHVNNDKESKEEELSQGPVHMEVEPTEDQKSKRSGLNLSLGDPTRASTPLKTEASTSNSAPLKESLPRTASSGRPHAGKRGEVNTSTLDDENFKEYIALKYDDLLDETCPLGDESLIALIKSERIHQKFLELSNERLSVARAQEDDTAADLHVKVAEIISKQIDGEAQAEAEANSYRHIARSEKIDGLAAARISYEANCEELESSYEQTVLAATSCHARKRAKVALEAKDDLNDLIQEMVAGMLQERSALVKELKREESWVLRKAQEYREEAFASHLSGHNDVAWVTNLFQAAAAAKPFLLPKSSWNSLSDLLNSVPSLSTSLYSALGGEYLMNRPRAHLDLSIEDTDDTSAKKLQALIATIHTRECSQVADQSFQQKKKNQIAPKGLKSAKKDKPPQPVTLAENERKTIEMSLEMKKMALDADREVLQHVRSRRYPNYSFVDVNRYYHGEAALVEEILSNTKSRTLLNRKEFRKAANMNREELTSMITSVIERDTRATAPKKKRLEIVTSLAFALTAEEDDIKPGGVKDERTTDDKVALVQYFHVMKKGSPHGYDEGLLDIHDKAALQRVSVVHGDPLKAMVCSWCGHATQNQLSTGAHIRKDHEGVLLVCECFEYAAFRPDNVSAHWKSCSGKPKRAGDRE